MNRKTISSDVSLAGRGVHSGLAGTLTLKPAEAGTGITFVRTDLPGQPEVPAHLDYLAPDELLRRTTLVRDAAKVHTVEHILSAAAALGLTDLRIEMDTPEPPFLDGSSRPFVEALVKAGSREMSGTVKPISLTRPVAFRDGSAEICAFPSNDYRVTFFYSSNHPRLRWQSASFLVNPEEYQEQIGPARTFCFFEEIEAMRKADLIKGANLSSAVVIGKKGVLNDSLRFDDEPVRHKILDFIGDLALLGKPLRGHFLAWRAGHKANAAFANYLWKELGL